MPQDSLNPLLARPIAPVVLQSLYDYKVARANGDDEFASETSATLRALGIEILDDGRNVTVRYIGPPGGETIEDMIAARAAARKARDWAEADRIRAELKAMSIVLSDSRDPKTGELITEWEYWPHD